MWRSQLAVWAACLCWGLTATMAQEQPRPPAPPEPAAEVDLQADTDPDRPGSVLRLIDSDLIRVELKVSEEQKREIQKLIEMAREDARRLQQRIPSEQQREAIAQAVKNQLAAVFQRYSDQIHRVLTPEQSARLNSMALQIRGIEAVLDPEIAAKLNLTPEQREQIAALIEKADQRREEIRKATRGRGKTGRQERRQARQELRDQLEKDIRAVLTPEQQQTFDKLKDAGVDVRKVDPSIEPDATIDLGAPAELEPNGGTGKP